MSEFLKGMLGKPDETMPADEAEKYFDDAMDEARRAMEECRKIISKAARPFADRGDYVNASIVTFAAAWMLIAWLLDGVRRSQKLAIENGDTLSPVKKAWDLIRIGCTSEDPDTDLEQYAKEHGLSDDD